MNCVKKNIITFCFGFICLFSHGAIAAMMEKCTHIVLAGKEGVLGVGYGAVGLLHCCSVKGIDSKSGEALGESGVSFYKASKRFCSMGKHLHKVCCESNEEKEKDE